MLQGVKHGLFSLALGVREGFIALVPYLVAVSAGLIIFHLSVWAGAYPKSQPVWPILQYLQSILPVLIVFSIAYHLARINGVDPSISALLAVSVFFSVYPIAQVLSLSGFTNLNVILCPIVTTYILIGLERLGVKRTPEYHSLSQGLMAIYQYTWVFLIAMFLGYIFVAGIESLAQWFSHTLNAFSLKDWSLEQLIFFRSIITPFLFFFGLHGPIVLDMSIGSAYLSQAMTTGLTGGTFHNLFVVMGGTGTCLALALAVLWNGKDQHALRTTKVALPFLVFNVSEILVYGLPVIFNRVLLIPFILVPAINFLLAYFVVVKLQLFTFSGVELPWITPAFLNIYLATDGNLLALLFQALLLFLDVVVYLYFVRKYLSTQVSSERFSRLNKALNLAVAFEGKQKRLFEEAQTYILSAHNKTTELVDLIIKNQMLMYYQPKVDVKRSGCQHFEALLRLQLKDGQVLPPDFLGDIERAGLVPVIDMWVCRQVASDMAHWAEQGFYPSISVNIHPDTLEDRACIENIIECLPSHQVELEFVERAFIGSESSRKHIALLIKHGYKLAVDDFGSGYSSLNNLNEIPANVIKIDKKLVDGAHWPRGQIMYQHVVSMCKALGYVTVAEGVETAAQLALVKQAGVDFVQGWYFAKAMPFEEVKGYSEKFVLNNPT